VSAYTGQKRIIYRALLVVCVFRVEVFLQQELVIGAVVCTFRQNNNSSSHPKAHPAFNTVGIKTWCVNCCIKTYETDKAFKPKLVRQHYLLPIFYTTYGR
jgi:hypothetical protein